ncbi:hypothetical protein H257_19472, partial [Aphanomyces astaci]
MKTIAILALVSSAATFAAGDTAASVQGYGPALSIRPSRTETVEVLPPFPELVKDSDVKSTHTQGNKNFNTDTLGYKDVSTDTQGDKDVSTDTQGDKD